MNLAVEPVSLIRPTPIRVENAILRRRSTPAFARGQDPCKLRLHAAFAVQQLLQALADRGLLTPRGSRFHELSAFVPCTALTIPCFGRRGPPRSIWAAVATGGETFTQSIIALAAPEGLIDVRDISANFK